MRRTPFAHICLLIAFLFNSIITVPIASAQELVLPKPGVMVHLSPPENPAMLKGIKVNPNNPFRFEFILDRGDSVGNADLRSLQDESTKLIKYFLASLTIPEKDLWVNLSPYEKDRIVPDSFGVTEMGRDLLAQDYMLKQVTASLIYPEDEVGKKFWKRVYEEAAKKYGTTNIPVNTFNKVWIVPEKAVVYENAKAGTAYVVESGLKVMLEQDYLSLAKHSSSVIARSVSDEAISTGTTNSKEIASLRSLDSARNDTNSIGSQIVREIVIPELTKEINEGKNFSQLRQVYNSLILATWYKKKIKDSILSKVYADKNKVQGVNIEDPQEKQKIYQQYLQAFKKGVYNYIKEDLDPATQQRVPRKYFSGGITGTDLALTVLQMTQDESQVNEQGDLAMVISEFKVGPDQAMSALNLKRTKVGEWNEPVWDEEKFQNGFKKIGFDPVGVLMFGADVEQENVYVDMMTEGIKPQSVHGHLQHDNLFPDHVSLSLSRDDHFFSSSISSTDWSPQWNIHNAVIILDRNYVREHKDDFNLVGEDFVNNEKFHHRGLEKLGLQARSPNYKGYTFPDEIQLKEGLILPLQAIAAVIVHPDSYDKILDLNRKLGRPDLPIYVMHPHANEYDIYIKKESGDKAMTSDRVRDRRQMLFSILDKQTNPITAYELYILLKEQEKYGDVEEFNVKSDIAADNSLKDHRMLKTRKDIVEVRRLELLKILSSRKKPITVNELILLLQNRVGYEDVKPEIIRLDMNDSRFVDHPKLRSDKVEASILKRRAVLLSILNEQQEPITARELADLLAQKEGYKRVLLPTVRTDITGDKNLSSHPKLRVKKDYRRKSNDDQAMTAEGDPAMERVYTRMNQIFTNGFSHVSTDLFDDKFLIYALSARQTVNPEDRPLSAIYGGAGADISGALVTLGSADNYFVSYYQGLSVNDLRWVAEKLQVLKKQGEFALFQLGNPDQMLRYLDAKHYLGGAHSADTENKAYLMVGLVLELNALRIFDIQVDDELGAPRIRFQWDTFGLLPAREYSITFIDTDITRPDQYPALLKEKINNGVDLYFQKRGFSIAQSYSQEGSNNFIRAIHRGMKEGAYFVTDDRYVSRHRKDASGDSVGIYEGDASSVFPLDNNQYTEVAIPQNMSAETVSEGFLRLRKVRNAVEQGKSDKAMTAAEDRAGNRNIEQILANERLGLSAADQVFLKSLEDLVIPTLGHKRYRLQYSENGSLSSRENTSYERPEDMFLIYEIDETGKPIPNQREVGSIDFFSWSQDGYMEKGELKIGISYILVNKEHQKGIFFGFLSQLPKGTMLKGVTVVHDETLLGMAKDLLAQDNLSEVLDEDSLATLRKMNDSSRNFNYFEESAAFKKYQENVVDKKGRFKSLSELFRTNGLGLILHYAGFRNIEVYYDSGFNKINYSAQKMDNAQLVTADLRINDKAMTALSPQELQEMQKNAPQWDWQLASQVPWRELVHDPHQPPPVNENEEHLWQNQNQVRREFLEMMNRLAGGRQIYESEFAQSLMDMNRILLLGKESKNYYRSPHRGNALQEEKIEQIAGEPFNRESWSLRAKSIQRDLEELIRMRPNVSLSEAVRRIAIFYRGLIEQNLFISGNNSLAMNMVNGLLRLYGLTGIPHSYLDLSARNEWGWVSDPDFSEVFLQIVAEQNGNSLLLQEYEQKKRTTQQQADDILEETLSPYQPIAIEAYDLPSQFKSPQKHDQKVNLITALQAVIPKAVSQAFQAAGEQVTKNIPFLYSVAGSSAYMFNRKEGRIMFEQVDDLDVTVYMPRDIWKVVAGPDDTVKYQDLHNKIRQQIYQQGVMTGVWLHIYYRPIDHLTQQYHLYHPSKGYFGDLKLMEELFSNDANIRTLLKQSLEHQLFSREAIDELLQYKDFHKVIKRLYWMALKRRDVQEAGRLWGMIMSGAQVQKADVDQALEHAKTLYFKDDLDLLVSNFLERNSLEKIKGEFLKNFIGDEAMTAGDVKVFKGIDGQSYELFFVRKIPVVRNINPGYVYRDGQGREFFVKFLQDPIRGVAEYLGYHFFKIMELPVPDSYEIMQESPGRLAVVSPYINDFETMGAAKRPLSKNNEDILRRAFYADSFLNTWDRHPDNIRLYQDKREGRISFFDWELGLGLASFIGMPLDRTVFSPSFDFYKYRDTNTIYSSEQLVQENFKDDFIRRLREHRGEIEKLFADVERIELFKQAFGAKSFQVKRFSAGDLSGAVRSFLDDLLSSEDKTDEAMISFEQEPEDQNTWESVFQYMAEEIEIKSEGEDVFPILIVGSGSSMKEAKRLRQRFPDLTKYPLIILDPSDIKQNVEGVTHVKSSLDAPDWPDSLPKPRFVIAIRSLERSLDVPSSINRLYDLAEPGASVVMLMDHPLSPRIIRLQIDLMLKLRYIKILEMGINVLSNKNNKQELFSLITEQLSEIRLTFSNSFYYQDLNIKPVYGAALAKATRFYSAIGDRIDDLSDASERSRLVDEYRLLIDQVRQEYGELLKRYNSYVFINQRYGIDVPMTDEEFKNHLENWGIIPSAYQAFDRVGDWIKQAGFQIPNQAHIRGSGHDKYLFFAFDKPIKPSKALRSSQLRVPNQKLLIPGLAPTDELSLSWGRLLKDNPNLKLRLVRSPRTWRDISRRYGVNASEFNGGVRYAGELLEALFFVGTGSEHEIRRELVGHELVHAAQRLQQGHLLFRYGSLDYDSTVIFYKKLKGLMAQKSSTISRAVLALEKHLSAYSVNSERTEVDGLGMVDINAVNELFAFLYNGLIRRENGNERQTDKDETDQFVDALLDQGLKDEEFKGLLRSYYIDLGIYIPKELRVEVKPLRNLTRDELIDKITADLNESRLVRVLERDDLWQLERPEPMPGIEDFNALVGNGVEANKRYALLHWLLKRQELVDYIKTVAEYDPNKIIELVGQRMAELLLTNLLSQQRYLYLHRLLTQHPHLVQKIREHQPTTYLFERSWLTLFARKAGSSHKQSVGGFFADQTKKRVSFSPVPEASSAFNFMTTQEMMPIIRRAVEGTDWEFLEYEDMMRQGAAELFVRDNAMNAELVSPALTLSYEQLRRLGIKWVAQGSQAQIETMDQWPFVLKRFLDLEHIEVYSSETIRSYQLAQERLGGLVPNFTFVNVQVDHRPPEVALVMEKISSNDLSYRMRELMKSKSVTDIAKCKEYIEQLVSLMRDVIRRGVYPLDVKFGNIDEVNGRMRLLDAGSIRDDLDRDVLRSLQYWQEKNSEFLVKELGSDELGAYYLEQLRIYDIDGEISKIPTYQALPVDPSYRVSDISNDITNSLKKGIPEEVSVSLAQQIKKLTLSVGAEQWLLREGMGFRQRATWWSPKTREESHGEENHLGMDFVVFKDAGGQLQAIPNGTAIPTMISGRVRWIFEDSMQSTVVVESPLYEGESLLTLYVHIRPIVGLKVGDEVKGGAVIGTVEASKNPNSIVASHLHLGLGVISDKQNAEIADALIDFDVLNQWAKDGQMINYLNPLEVLSSQVRRTMFVEGTRASLGIQSILIKGKNDAENKQLRKALRFAFPGLKDFILQNETETIVKKPQMLIIRQNESGLWDIDGSDYQQRNISFDSIINTIANEVNSQDWAMNTSGPGGIDLTSDKALQVKNSGEGIKLNIDSAMLKQLQNAPGFYPVIISIQPMVNLREFLGIAEKSVQQV